jgi:hypothetical protein
MVFPTRGARFISFLSFFNEKLLKKGIKPISIIDDYIIPSLKDA